MKRPSTWRLVIILLSAAWLSFIVEVLLAAYYMSYPPYRPSEPMQVVIGLWVYAWWACHAVVAAILIYKASNWVARRKGLSKG